MKAISPEQSESSWGDRWTIAVPSHGAVILSGGGDGFLWCGEWKRRNVCFPAGSSTVENCRPIALARTSPARMGPRRAPTRTAPQRGDAWYNQTATPKRRNAEKKWFLGLQSNFQRCFLWELLLGENDELLGWQQVFCVHEGLHLQPDLHGGVLSYSQSRNAVFQIPRVSKPAWEILNWPRTSATKCAGRGAQGSSKPWNFILHIEFS